MQPRRHSASSLGGTPHSDLSRSNSSRTNDQDIEQVSFFLHGTPAPRYSRRSVKHRIKPIPPPNSPCVTPMPPRLLPLPIDRIMILKDRLSTNISSPHGSHVFSNGSDKCSNDDVSYKYSRPETQETTSSRKSPAASSKKTEMGRRQASDLNFSDVESSIASSHPDLSIDLTSITDSDHDSESSHETDRGHYCHSGTESSRRINYYSSSPLFVPQHRSKAHLMCRRSSYFSSETSSNSPHSCTLKNLTSLPLQKSSSSSSQYAGSSKEESSRTYNTHSRRSTDLICIYVDTVSNTELGKYLRPCSSCHEPCCICPDIARPNNEQKIINPGVNLSTRSDANQLLTSVTEAREDAKNEETVKSDDTSQKDTMNKRPESQLSDFSQFLLERVNQGDSGNCTLDEKSHSSILSRRHLSLSLMQLSTAAQCARILAESLEGVLQLAKEEVMSLAESPVQSDTEAAPDSLRNALDMLKKTYPKGSTEFLLAEMPRESNASAKCDLDSTFVGLDKLFVNHEREPPVRTVESELSPHLARFPANLEAVKEPECKIKGDCEESACFINRPKSYPEFSNIKFQNSDARPISEGYCHGYTRCSTCREMRSE